MSIEKIGILLSLLSLLITILGWSITARYQKQILERQIAAEREKDIRQIIIPRKIQQLETIKDWVENGYKLWHRWKDRPRQEYMFNEKLKAQREEIDKRIHNWVSVEYMPVESILDIIEPYETREDDNLADMLSKFASAMPTGNPHYYDEHPNFETNTDLFFDKCYSEIMQKIDGLIEQVVREKRPSQTK
jgi:hypothetical protein